MPLIYDRASQTAAQLNSFLAEATRNLATALPYDYRGNVSNIEIDETDDVASNIVDYKTALEALAHVAGLTQENINVIVSTNSDNDLIMTAYKRSEDPTEIDQTSSLIIFDYNVPIGTENTRNIHYGYLGELDFGRVTFTSGAVIKDYQLDYLNEQDGWYKYGSIAENRFEDTGYENWAVGVTSLISKLYLEHYGFDEWTLTKQYKSTGEENWKDFPEGISPSPSSNCPDKYQDLSSQVDGSNTTFTVQEDFVSDCLKVYYNGQRIRSGTDYNVINSTQFTTTFTPVSSSSVFVDYVAS